MKIEILNLPIGIRHFLGEESCRVQLIVLCQNQSDMDDFENIPNAKNRSKTLLISLKLTKLSGFPYTP